VASEEHNPNQVDATKEEFNMIDGGIAANNPVGFSSDGPIRAIFFKFYAYESFFKTYTYASIVTIWDIQLGPELCIDLDCFLLC
jgi:hypothetical protein